jgi:hypothetical protein
MCCTSYTMKGIIRATKRNRKVGANKSTRLSPSNRMAVVGGTKLAILGE